MKKLIAAFSVRPGTPTASEEQISAGEDGSRARAPGDPRRALPRGRRRHSRVLFADRASAPTSRKAARSASSTASATCSSPRSTSTTRFCAAIAPTVSATCSSAAAARTSIRASPRRRECAIVEVDEIVEPGVIPPELIDLPGIFVARVVKTTQRRRRQGVAPSRSGGPPTAAPLQRQARADARRASRRTRRSSSRKAPT